MAGSSVLGTGEGIYIYIYIYKVSAEELHSQTYRLVPNWVQYIYALEKDGCAPPHHSNVFPTLPLTARVQCSSDLQWPSGISQSVVPSARKVTMCLLIPCLSPPGDQWSDVLGCFVSPRWYLKLLNTFRASKMQTTYGGCSPPPPPLQSICLVIFLHSGHIQGSTSRVSKGGCQTLTRQSAGHPAIPFFTFCQ